MYPDQILRASVVLASAAGPGSSTANGHFSDLTIPDKPKITLRLFSSSACCAARRSAVMPIVLPCGGRSGTSRFSRRPDEITDVASSPVDVREREQSLPTDGRDCQNRPDCYARASDCVGDPGDVGVGMTPCLNLSSAVQASP
jgi:hypothetical protein